MPAIVDSSVTLRQCGDPANENDCYLPVRPLCGLTPALTLQPMTPECVHKGVDAALRVDRIEWLEVVSAEKDPLDHVTYFTINIFLKQNQSRLPTSRLIHHSMLKQSLETNTKPTRKEPDYSVRRSFADLHKLYEDVMRAVQQRSHGQFCHLCNDFQTFLLFTNTRLLLTFKALLSLDAQTKLVQKAIHPLVGLFQDRQPTAGRRDGCESAHEIPVVLHRFLLENEPY